MMQRITHGDCAITFIQITNLIREWQTKRDYSRLARYDSIRLWFVWAKSCTMVRDLKRFLGQIERVMTAVEILEK